MLALLTDKLSYYIIIIIIMEFEYYNYTLERSAQSIFLLIMTFNNVEIINIITKVMNYNNKFRFYVLMSSKYNRCFAKGDTWKSLWFINASANWIIRIYARRISKLITSSTTESQDGLRASFKEILSRPNCLH